MGTTTLLYFSCYQQERSGFRGRSRADGMLLRTASRPVARACIPRHPGGHPA